MPLLKFDVVEGRTEAQLGAVLDAAHRAVLTAFKVPASDRYQVVTEHKAHQLRALDTGLGLQRTHALVILTVVTSPRSREAKQAFFAELVRELGESCGIAPSDVIVSVVTNAVEDWSFGNGVAQYVTGEL